MRNSIIRSTFSRRTQSWRSCCGATTALHGVKSVDSPGRRWMTNLWKVSSPGRRQSQLRAASELNNHCLLRQGQDGAARITGPLERLTAMSAVATSRREFGSTHIAEQGHWSSLATLAARLKLAASCGRCREKLLPSRVLHRSAQNSVTSLRDQHLNQRCGCTIQPRVELIFTVGKRIAEAAF